MDRDGGMEGRAVMPWRWLLLGVIAWLVYAAVLFGQSQVFDLAIGRVGATDQELQECYFNIGTGAMLVLKPGGIPCQRARELIGRTGTLMFVAD